MLGLSPGIKISISLERGHSTFVLSTIDNIEFYNKYCVTGYLPLTHDSLGT